ncbi:uncharacterized protein LOC129589106 isoform X1 [Paramacrobiotus metropolitanus]|uniref:uncharacterized protein LOC129589106 isoform X1 n=1 Tax=Paramacrobiotus metropolitanus TaxID=2943436 RepID=UPI0024461955|nr:uncharacterized protein LOC129589106 isoform X1 [Paramacrobiotus metropolitanus]
MSSAPTLAEMQALADQVKDGIMMRSGRPIQEFVVEKFRIQNVQGSLYTAFKVRGVYASWIDLALQISKIRAGGGRYLHAEVFQHNGSPPVLVGLERYRTADDPLIEVAHYAA